VTTLKIKTSFGVVVASAVVLFIVIRAAGAANGPVPGWDPDAFNDQSTLQIMTTAPRRESTGQSSGWSQ